MAGCVHETVGVAVDSSTAAVLAGLDLLPAGLPLAAGVEDIAARELTPFQRLQLMQLRQRLVSGLHAEQAADAALISDALDGQWAVDEISPALRISMTSATDLMCLGRSMRAGLPRTREALCNGTLNHVQATAVERALRSTNPATARAVEVQVLERAEELPPLRLGREAKKLRIALDPDAANLAHALAKADRQTAFYDNGDASATYAITGPVTAVAAYAAAIQARAGKTGPDDERNADQRRFDAVIASVMDPEAKFTPFQVNVTTTVGTAFALANNPALLRGLGPIAPDAVRELEQDATFRAFLLDAATKGMQGLGTKTYRPHKRLREFNKARHEYSVQPMSTVRSDVCDGEHAVPYEDGGATDETNTAPHDGRGHRTKHEGGWTHVQEPDGTRHITSRLGFRYTSRPTVYPLDPDPEERPRPYC